MKKTVLAVLLGICMLFSLVPTFAFASSGEASPPDEAPAPPENTAVICPVCQAESCTQHSPCTTCGNYGCAEDHSVVPANSPEVCTTCGKADCSGQHENWCDICQKDNCGEDHSAPKLCTTCGNAECICAPAASGCTTCGKADCSGQHENWCVICKEDNCGVDHSGPKLCADCNNEPCTCGSEPQEILPEAEANTLYVNSEYDGETEGFGQIRFSSYRDAYSHAAQKGGEMTIVIEANAVLSGNSFHGEEENYSRIKVVIKDGVTISFDDEEESDRVLIAGEVTLKGNSSIDCPSIELTTENSFLKFNDTSTTTATTIVISNKSAKLVGDKSLPVSLAESLQENYMLHYDEATRTYSVRTIRYTISYELGGGTLAEGSENPETYSKDSEAITLNNPVKVGYTFSGWTGTELEEPTETLTIAKGSTGDRSYTATWTEEQVTITYQVVGDTGSGFISKMTEKIGAVTGNIEGSTATAERQYAFEGWYTDFECTQPVNEEWVDSANKLTPGRNADGIYESAAYYVKFRRTEVDLTFTLSGGKSGSVYLFTVVGTNPGEESVELKLAVKGGETVTVRGLPPGNYTVTPDNSWNWRETVTVTLNGELTNENGEAVVSVAGKGDNRWFNGYAYAQK